jgi:predicted nucleic acid-binding protein
VENKKRNLLIVLLLLLIAVSSGWLFTRYYHTPSEKGDSPLIELKDGIHRDQATFGINGEDTVAVKIFYPSEDGVISEDRTIQNKPLPVAMADVVIEEYLKGLKEDLKNAKLLGVYRDRNNVLYIDLSDEFRRNFSGDARQEYYLLKSLFDTVVANVAGTEDLRLLVEGKEIESIGGHFSILYGLKSIAHGS